jgi:tripartite-type tricarboxylate transporter receptor subunit TctC
MINKPTRRDALKLAAAGASLAAVPALSFAATSETYPSRPLTIVCPYPPGGYADNFARALTGPLQKAFGQPVTLVNKPGANALLGHKYFLDQPDEGYQLLVTTVNFIALNVLVQGADFKPDAFSAVNLPNRDFSLLATSAENKELKTLDDVIKALKADPASLSIGIQAASSDFVNLMLLADAAGLPRDKFRLVTYDGGSQARTAVVGSVVDLAITGGEGFLSLKDQIRPLLTFDAVKREPYGSPSASDIKLGKPLEYVPGSVRGFMVQTSFKNKYPDRYATVLATFERVFRDPEVVSMLNNQQLASKWEGPDASNKLYSETFDKLKANVALLKGN